MTSESNRKLIEKKRHYFKISLLVNTWARVAFTLYLIIAIVYIKKYNAPAGINKQYDYLGLSMMIVGSIIMGILLFSSSPSVTARGQKNETFESNNLLGYSKNQKYIIYLSMAILVIGVAVRYANNSVTKSLLNTHNKDIYYWICYMGVRWAIVIYLIINVFATLWLSKKIQKIKIEFANENKNNDSTSDFN